MPIITDLFNYKNIDNETPFLIIHGDNLSNLLTLKDTKDKSYIYQLNFKEIYNLLKKYPNLNIQQFVSPSDILLYKYEIPTKLLLVNIDLVKFPVDYVAVEIFNNGTCWEPVGVPGYKSLGLIYEKENKKPNNNTIPMLPIDILNKINIGPSTGIRNNQEFKTLSNNIHGYWEIDKNKIVNDPNDYFKLLTYDGKYLTKVNDSIAQYDSNTLRSPNQIIKHTINGQLIINDKCLNSDLKFENCSDKQSHKWDILENKIISKDNNMCLTINEDNKFEMQNCKYNDEYQKFTKQNPDIKSNLVNDFQWVNPKGRKVVLTYNDNPFFLNKDIVKSEIDKTSSEFHINDKLLHEKLRGVTEMNERGYNANVQSTPCIIEPCNMNKCNKYEIETFDGNSNKSYYFITIIIISIVLIYFIYKNKSLFFKN